jgi:hypothetical protein
LGGRKDDRHEQENDAFRRQQSAEDQRFRCKYSAREEAAFPAEAIQAAIASNCFLREGSGLKAKRP